MKGVLITGASRGIGRALAERVPFEARVVDVSRSGPPEGSGWDHVGADLSRPEDWAELAAGLGRIVEEAEPERAVLVHAAGTLTPIGFVGEVPDADYAANVVLNSAAGQVVGHLFLRMTARLPGRRDVVMISSGAATTPYEGWSGYNAGKAALDHWVRTVGAEQELRGGAWICAIGPGVVATRMQEQIRATDADDFPAVGKFRDLHREGELGDPDDVARRLWEVVESRSVDSGSVVDLREL